MALGNHRQKFQYPFQNKCLYDESPEHTVVQCFPHRGVWTQEMADAQSNLWCILDLKENCRRHNDS